MSCLHNSSLTLVPAGLFLPRVPTPISWLLLHSRLSQLLRYAIPDLLPLSLMDLPLGSSRSILELAGFRSLQHGQSFWHLLTEVIPASPCYQTLPHKTNAQLLANFSSNSIPKSSSGMLLILHHPDCW